MRCLVIGLVLSLLLSACVSADEEHTTVSVRSADQPESVEDDPATLRLALVRSSLARPADVELTDQGAVIVADLLYDGLTEIDASSGTLRPGLASSWEANDDFSRWTFQIDPDAGLSAVDIAASLEPLVGRRTGPALTAGIAALSTPDDDTLVVDLGRSNAGFAWIVSGLPYSVVGPDGGLTGHYQIGRETAEELRLVRRLPPTDGGSIEEVVVSWVDDDDHGRRLVEAGTVDLAVVDSATAEGYPNQRRTMAGVRYYVLNLDSPSLVNLDQRRRVLEEVDQVDVVTDLNQESLVAVDGLVPATWLGYRPIGQAEPPEERTANSSRQPLRMAYAGSDQAALADAVSQQLTEAGLEIRQEELAARELAQRIVDGATDLFSFGWVAPAGTVDAVLPPLLAADSPANTARIDSPVVDALLERAAVTADDEARWDLLASAQEAALAEATLLPIGASSRVLLLDAGGRGVALRPDGSLDLDSSASAG